MGANSQDNKSLLNRITPPDLSQSDYARSLSEVINKIQENFNKFASLPFLQGVKGDGFVIQREDLFVRESSGYVNDNDVVGAVNNVLSENPTKNTYLSEWGKKIVKAILYISSPSTPEEERFNNELLTELAKDDVTLSGINHVIDNGVPCYKPIRSYEDYPCDMMIKNNYVVCYVTKDDSGEVTGEYIAQMYYHIDCRISKISDIQGSENNFKDTTNIFSYNSLTGEFVKMNLSPSIYYNDELKDWCWMIGGEETGISAKGITGDNGKDGSKMWTVSVTPLGDNNQIIPYEDGLHSLDIQYVLGYRDGSNSNPVWLPIDDFKDKIKDGDICWINIYDHLNPDEQDSMILDYAFGSVLIVNNKYKATFNATNLFRTWGNKLREELIYINHRTEESGETILTNGCRGLWIPGNDPVAMNGVVTEINNVHMLWKEDDGNNIQFGMVDNPSILNPTPLPPTPTYPQFNILYNVVNIGSFEARNGSTLFGNTQFVNNKENDKVTFDILARFNEDIKIQSNKSIIFDHGNDSVVISSTDEKTLQIQATILDLVSNNTTDPALLKTPGLEVNGDPNNINVNIKGSTLISNRLGVGTEFFPSNILNSPNTTLYVSGSGYISNNLTVKGKANIGNGLEVNNGSKLNGDTNINNGVIVKALNHEKIEFYRDEGGIDIFSTDPVSKNLDKQWGGYIDFHYPNVSDYAARIQSIGNNIEFVANPDINGGWCNAIGSFKWTQGRFFKEYDAHSFCASTSTKQCVVILENNDPHLFINFNYTYDNPSLIPELTIIDYNETNVGKMFIAINLHNPCGGNVGGISGKVLNKSGCFLIVLGHESSYNNSRIHCLFAAPLPDAIIWNGI